MGLINLYRRCDMGMAGFVWPDGGAYLDQPVRLIEAFDVIRTSLAKKEPGA